MIVSCHFTYLPPGKKIRRLTFKANEDLIFPWNAVDERCVLPTSKPVVNIDTLLLSFR